MIGPSLVTFTATLQSTWARATSMSETHRCRPCWVPGAISVSFMIATAHDEVVTPYQTQFLSGPDVTNITLQDVCALDRTDHLGIIYDEVALHLVLNALDPLHATPAPCTVVLPGLGG